MSNCIYINGENAREKWGLVLGYEALNVLLAPAPMKSFVENKSPQEHGKTIYPHNPHIDERDVQLPILILASSGDEFLQRYRSFATELQKGVFRLRVVCGGIDETYNMLYLSCQQFSQFNMRCGKFLLRLSEPNPANRNTNPYAGHI